MQIKEKIRLAGKPFPKPLPRPAKKLIALFASPGYQFKDMGRTLLLYDSFSPSRFERIKELIKDAKLDLKIDYSRRTVFEEQD